MIHFECDYAEGAHPRILERLSQTNDEQTLGYGEDEHCAKAAGYIRKYCGREDADVHFLVGGTQANLTVIGALLRSHQGVLSAGSGHVVGHETGAIEATGHKVLTLTSLDGKITGDQVDRFCQSHHDDINHEHIVQPGMAYISHPSENGTIYTKPELAALRKACDKWGIPLYMDGARMGYGLAASKNMASGETGKPADECLALQDIASLCDLFYIGGTKVGAMFGEALVIVNEDLKKDFRYQIKQRGAMLAKGRMLGIQFEALFEDGLYFRISEHAVAMADRIREACRRKGFNFLHESPANQVFPILPLDAIRILNEKYVFFERERTGEKEAAVRLCTSWATKEEHIRQLTEDIMKL
ncbi:MAG: low specificity L-threonine aldolase [Peptococcaceae bacterium]|jgi:threonine aldolase|nr:low specificity L-threonine aldolase [Peptococcaceae bacterium]